jgi:hypothetical protein
MLTGQDREPAALAGHWIYEPRGGAVTEDQPGVTRAPIRQSGPFLIAVVIVIAAAAAAGILLATGTFGHGSTPGSADRYCPSVLNALPGSAPASAGIAASDIGALTAVTPAGTDQRLDARIHKVDRAIERIGRAYSRPGSSGPSARRIAKFYKAASKLRSYCR